MLLTTAAALLQISVLPLLFLDPWSAPLLPIALIASWSVNRSHDQTWPALLPAALLPGVVSTQQIGWFLVALLPVALLGSVIAQTRADEERGFLWRIPAAAAVAGLGTLAYLLVLPTAGGEIAALADAAGAIVSAALGTSVLAAALTPLLRPRRQRHGLFA